MRNSLAIFMLAAMIGGLLSRSIGEADAFDDCETVRMETWSLELAYVEAVADPTAPVPAQEQERWEVEGVVIEDYDQLIDLGNVELVME